MGTNYETVSIAPTTVLDETKRPGPGWLVTFVTKPSEQTGELRIAGADLDPTAAAAMLTDLAGKIEQLKAS
jgi:hypothetical protein